MSSKASITVLGSPEEVQRRWADDQYRPGYIEKADAAVSFKPAPGDRGTEIHVDLEMTAPGGKLGEAVQKVKGDDPVAKVKDTLRRFKAKLETGEYPRSEAVPEGEQLDRKLKMRPAQPLDADELEKAGV